ncbi:MAG TPA: hypothetical protein VKY22_10170 [Bradyrhizobium sp.]|nr:hypothetical protein [Bradyrhizobium sp.]
MAFPLGACSLFERRALRLRCVLGHQGYSAIAPSSKIENSARAMRVAARQGARGTLLIIR